MTNFIPKRGQVALAQLAPQEALIAASHGLIEPLLKWAGAAANPVARFGIGGGVHLATGAAGGAVSQVGENIAEKKPDIFQGVGEAAQSGMVQALPFAIHGGVGALLGHEPVVKAPETPLGEHGPPIESVPIDTGVEHGPQPNRRPVTGGEILGPDEPPATRSAALPYRRRGSL